MKKATNRYRAVQEAFVIDGAINEANEVTATAGPAVSGTAGPPVVGGNGGGAGAAGSSGSACTPSYYAQSAQSSVCELDQVD